MFNGALRVSNLNIVLSYRLTQEALVSGSLFCAHFAVLHPNTGFIQAYFQRKEGAFKCP
jgi:hypothetical protein